MKRISQLLLVGLMVIFAGTAIAGPWGRGMGQGQGYGMGQGRGQGQGQGYGMGACPYTAANLTANQAAQLQTLRESFQKEIAPLQSEMFAKRSEMRSLWSASPADEGRITALQKDLLELQGKVQERRLQFNLECRKIATL